MRLILLSRVILITAFLFMFFSFFAQRLDLLSEITISYTFVYINGSYQFTNKKISDSTNYYRLYIIHIQIGLIYLPSNFSSSGSFSICPPVKRSRYTIGCKELSCTATAPVLSALTTPAL